MLTTEWGHVRYPSCRDKGRMRGRVGAWCLSWWQRDPVGTAWSNQVAPQRGQAPGPLIHSTPPLVPTGPWAASTSMDRIPRFGRQHSLEENISLLDWMVHPCKHYNRNRKKKILVEPGNIWTSKIGVNHLTKQPASHRLQSPVNIEASASLTTLRSRSRRPRRAANLIICQASESPWI